MPFFLRRTAFLSFYFVILEAWPASEIEILHIYWKWSKSFFFPLLRFSRWWSQDSMFKWTAAMRPSRAHTDSHTHTEGMLDQSPTAQLRLTVGLRMADSPGHVNSVVWYSFPTGDTDSTVCVCVCVRGVREETFVFLRRVWLLECVCAGTLHVQWRLQKSCICFSL